MRLSRSLGLAAAAAAGLGFASGADAAGTSYPNVSLTFSAQSIALAAGANTVTLPSTTAFSGGTAGYLGYVATVAGAITPVGSTVVWTAAVGDTFTILDPGIVAPATSCFWLPAGVFTLPTVAGNAVTCTSTVAAQTSVSLVNNGGITGNKVSLSGADIAQLGLNVFPGLAAGGGGASAQSGLSQINGASIGDTAPGLPTLALTSKNSFALGAGPLTLLVDLGGGGLPAIAPGAGFLQPLANGTRPVTTAGYLGFLNVAVSQTDLDARSGQAGISGPATSNVGAINALDASAITGTVSTALSGDFATLTSAYLVPNNSGVPDENAANCTAVAPANAILGAIDAAKRNITFATFTTPSNTVGATNPFFGVCLVTNGTQVIQDSPVIGAAAANAIQLIASVAVTGVANPYFLTPAPSMAFGSIAYQGSVFFAQNVFGANNLYPTFFRVVNGSNAAVKVFAILTKDVNNVVPETGNGSCADPGGATSTCNISFVTNLTALTDPTGLSKGLVQPNTAAYYTADAIAALAGTSLPSGSLHATVYLMSPSSGVRFSAVSQNPVNLDLITVP